MRQPLVIIYSAVKNLVNYFMKKLILIIVLIQIISTVIYSQSSVVQQILNSSEQDSLIYFVRELSGNVSTTINGTTQTILSRHKLQPGNSLAETYIKQKLQSYGLLTTIQSFSTTGKNVFAVQTGTEFPNQKYIICAHFDDMPSGTTAPGADDNASGTAAVIEAARIFSQHSFPFTIVYALWDEEEQGLVGSEYYAAQAENAGDSILGVINMDMIAYDGNGDSNADIHDSPVANTGSIIDKMLEVNLLYGINLDLDVVPSQPYSDHESFLNHGYGAVLLIEDDDDFHPHYHTVNDHIQYFNQSYFLKCAKLAFATLASLALNLHLNILHDPVISQSQSTPINTYAFISTGLEIGTDNLAPRLYYRSKSGGGIFGSFSSVAGNLTESGNYFFTIPAHQSGTIVQYYIAAQDLYSTVVNTVPSGGSGFNPPGNTPPESFYQYYIAPQEIVLNDEANNINNWTSAGGWNTTATKYVSPPTSFTDSPSGNYSNNITATLVYDSLINLDGILGAVLEFDSQWAIESDWDYGQIQLSTNNGTSWIPIEGQFTNAGTGSFQPNGEPLYDGIQSTWIHEIIDISEYADNNILLRFLLRTDASLNEDGWYIDNIKLTTYNFNFSLSVMIQDGWNMVSVPGVHPTNQNVNTWWQNRDPLADVYRWIGSYQSVSITEPSQGYWMLHTGANTYNTGDEWPAGGIQIVSHDPISISTGWNMIGAYDQSVPVGSITTTPSGLIVPNTIYGWNGAYFNPASLVPGYGYWVLVNGNGVINVPTVLDGGTTAKQEDRSSWGKIIITDAAQRSFTLYAIPGKSGNGSSVANLDSYQLPPLPPAGSFDVRFSSQRIAEDLNSEQIIEMSGLVYPVTVAVENVGLRIKDESGKLLNTKINNGEELQLDNNLLNKLVVAADVIPASYSLEQNYPNPFNPNTNIEFSLPEDVENVRLIIYDALGQKVMELVNSKLEAGNYKYQWDASDAASGLYVYELRTTNYSAVKKMLLLK